MARAIRTGALQGLLQRLEEHWQRVDAPLPLDRAVAEYHRMRTLDREIAEAEPGVRWPDDVWPPTWFPLGAGLGEDVLAISCDVPEGASAAVRHWDTESLGVKDPAGTLTEVVATWVRMLDAGLVRWADGMWLPDTTRYDPEVWRRAGSF